MTLESIELWNKLIDFLLVFWIFFSSQCLINAINSLLIASKKLHLTWESIQIFKKIIEFFFRFLDFLIYSHIINTVNDLLISSMSLILNLENIKFSNKFINFLLGFLIFWVIRAVLTPLITCYFSIYWHLVNAVNYLLIAWRSLIWLLKALNFETKSWMFFAFF